jgi:hypothetical protein
MRSLADNVVGWLESERGVRFVVFLPALISLVGGWTAWLFGASIWIAAGLTVFAAGLAALGRSGLRRSTQILWRGDRAPAEAASWGDKIETWEQLERLRALRYAGTLTREEWEQAHKNAGLISRRPVPRVLNLAVADSRQQLVEKQGQLEVNGMYLLRVDVGRRRDDSVVENPVPVPVELLEPSSMAGYWFDVVVVSSDVKVDLSAHRLFVPFEGASWVCKCTGPEHKCTSAQRRRHLFVPFRTSAEPGEAVLRCTIYHGNNAVQSARVRLAVGVRSPYGAASAFVDYTLSPDFAEIDRLEPRRLNILSNETPQGTHTIIVNDGERVIAVDLNEAQAGQVLTQLRAKLREITLGPDGLTSQYGDDNEKPPNAFVTDVKQLALLGSQLWAAVVQRREDRLYLREQLTEQAKIQIARVGKVVFPWSLVYDIPRELDATQTLCPLLEDWSSERRQLISYPARCPHEQHHHMNVVCPYGFWGFRHLIEQPASVRQGVLRTAIPVRKRGRATLARSFALDRKLTDEHFDKLNACLQDWFEPDPCDSREALRKALADPGLPLVYFYCHGKSAALAGTELEVPFLEIGLDEKIGPGDFLAWDEDGNWGPDHWSDVAPLIFINGCQTVDLSPEDVVSFVDALAGLDAAGIVGTEIPVAQRVAGEVAVRFYGHFAGLDATTVGIALHRTRFDLLSKGNLSGLAYTPFSSMDLRLIEAA